MPIQVPIHTPNTAVAWETLPHYTHCNPFSPISTHPTQALFSEFFQNLLDTWSRIAQKYGMWCILRGLRSIFSLPQRARYVTPPLVRNAHVFHPTLSI